MIVVSGGCFAATPLDRHLWWMLCRCATIQTDIGCRGLFASGCFVAVVISAPLADALPPRLLGHPRADTLSPMLLEACLVAFAVPLHCWLPMCCCLHVLGLVGWGLMWRVSPPRVFLLFVCACGVALVIHRLLVQSYVTFKTLYFCLIKYLPEGTIVKKRGKYQYLQHQTSFISHYPIFLTSASFLH
jgi:hypothetical protein